MIDQAIVAQLCDSDTECTDGNMVSLSNTSEWLMHWVCSLAGSRNQAFAFLMRYGMAGVKPLSFPEIGRQLGGLTRQRAQQQVKTVESRIFSKDQVQRVRLLAEIASQHVYNSGSILGVEELADFLFKNGEYSEYFTQLGKFVKLLARSPIWEEQGLSLADKNTVTNLHFDRAVDNLATAIRTIVEKNAEETIHPEFWRVSKSRIHAIVSNSITSTEHSKNTVRISDAAFELALTRCSELIIPENDQIYSVNYWKLLYGSKREIVETMLLLAGAPMHFTNVAKALSNWHSELSVGNVHASLTRSEKCLNYQRGTFIHIDQVDLPVSLINDIMAWLENALLSGIPFISMKGAFKKFSSRCKLCGVPDYQLLYSFLRTYGSDSLEYPRMPYTYLKSKMEERVPLLMEYERYFLDAGGFVSFSEVDNYWKDELHLDDLSVFQLFDRSNVIIQADESGLIHIENLDLIPEEVNLIIEHIERVLDKHGHCSISRIYNDKKLACFRLGIEGPVMLFSILQYFLEDSVCMNKNTGLTKIDRQSSKPIQSIKEITACFVKEYGKPCPFDVLEEKYVKDLGYRDGSVYSVSNHDDIVLYHKSCVVAKNVLQWNPDKQNQFEQLAATYYDTISNAGEIYARVSVLTESPKLPKLPSGLYWSRVMVAHLLRKEGNFVVLGNEQEAFLPKNNKFNISTFEALLSKVLDIEFSGASNLNIFSKYLASIGIVKKRLTVSMLGHQNHLVAKEGVVMLRELTNV